ncbi:MAG: hypothetical protein QOD66_1782, partial [Solirubrobacteraceae bacterium]|nr:hypothetical protein [Solirubrobacteraceae bacterium]
MLGLRGVESEFVEDAGDVFLDRGLA